MNARTERAAAYRIFRDALELPPAGREALLAARCGADAALRRMVVRLLAIADTDSTATGMLLPDFAPPDPERIGREYGAFRLVERLATGGMGTVYRAERIDGVPQTVAVKVLREGVTAASGALFLREAQILARLEHPSIARLIDVGVRDGEGWIAMEFVRGQPITDYCDSHRLDLPGRVRLLLAVADAIATAHRALIVHRDVKPSNVLVTESGEPKLIDFGIASALARPSETRAATAEVGTLFTPHYAAPEQVRNEPVTAATDVFGLGALAYRVLTGCEPYAHVTSAVGYLMAVTQEDVARPSVAAAGADALAYPAARLRGDLDSILMKALEREPARRYPGVQEMQADFAAYLEGRPVRAHPGGWSYRLGKFVRRRALPLAVAALLGAAVLAGALIYFGQERRVAQAELTAARRDEFLESLLRSADPYRGESNVTTLAELLDKASSQVDVRLRGEPLVQASMLHFIAQTNLGLGRVREGHSANERELDILRRNGGGPLEIGRALSLSGQLYRYESRWAESQRALAAAVALLEPLGVAGDLCTALDNLAAAQLNLQQLDAAGATLRRELAIEHSAGPGLLRQQMQANESIGVLLGAELGRYQEAAHYTAEGWALAQKLLPPDDPDRFSMEDAYAVALRNLGKPAEAEPLFRDAVARSIRVLGPQHHDTLVNELGLGNDLLELHRYAEAAELAASVAHSLESTLGPESWYTLFAWNEYGTASCNDGHATQGLAALERVAAVRARTLPAGHRLIYSTNIDIGSCLTRLHRYSEAEPLLLEAADGLTRSRGTAYRRTQDAYAALRDLYEDMNQPQAANRWTAKITPPPGR
ncbi:MAG TPA: serine/threonine-protein kinase [Solirubrobacteraceae bacterium]|nr:serine/threonine-protein kinase [Solirubrobacteraceae bacterium]